MSPTVSGSCRAPLACRLVLVGACTALLGACDSRASRPTTHDQYVAALHEVERSPRARDASLRFTRIVGARLSASECRAATARLADDLRTSTERVTAITPPAAAARAHARLVAEARETVSVIEHLASRVQAGTLACGIPFNRLAYGLPTTVAAERALRELAELGYCTDTSCSE